MVNETIRLMNIKDKVQNKDFNKLTVEDMIMLIEDDKNENVNLEKMKKKLKTYQV